MSKFNKKTKSTIINQAGGQAYSQSNELELMSLGITSMLRDLYYESSDDRVERLKDLISKNDKKFVAKTALYARNKCGLRSITHIIAGEIANKVKNENWTKDFIDKAIFRVDDMTEILAYYGNTYGKPIPNCLKKGFKKAFTKFDRYQLAKYRGKNKSVKLVDIVNLVHPKHTKDIEDLIKGNLKSKNTWESKLTQAGQNAETEEKKQELKEKAWQDLLNENKLGYFALLRNLRNISECKNQELIRKALEQLINEKAIKNSLVMPFRFMTAYEQFEQSRDDNSKKIIMSLNKAIDLSLNNVPKFEGKTLICLDDSGSMDNQQKSYNQGALFSAVLQKTNPEADFCLFGDGVNFYNLNSLDSTITLYSKILSMFRSGSTDFNNLVYSFKKKYDNIIVLSDMQGWVDGGAPKGYWNEYKKNFGIPNLFAFDLTGYGNMMFPENQVYCLAGFSDKVFDVMKLLTQDRKAMINEINKIEL